jgi:hypothetical protein
VLLANCASGNIVFTLPAVGPSASKVFYLKKIDSSAFTMTIKGNGSDLIDGSNTQVAASQYVSYSVVSDGANWWIL